jgi:hypothetical protein
MGSWHSYASIFALGHRALSELFDGPVLIEEKVDGSQFSFGIIDGELMARSKGKVMVIDAPEKMFESAITVIRTLPLHPGWTYRGEYLQKPKHNCLAYNRTPRNHIILFDINTDEECYLTYDQKAAEAERIGLEIVPRMHEGALEGAEHLRILLDTESVLGGVKIEGVVVKNYAKFGPDKKVLMGKFVSEAFKEKHVKEWKAANPGKMEIVQALIAGLKTEARWNKAVQHLRESGNLEGSPRDIGNLLKEIQADVKKECEDEIKEALFRYAWPQIQRGIIAGAPEWYKQKLMESQFQETA